MIEMTLSLSLDEAYAVTNLLTAMRDAGEEDPEPPAVYDVESGGVRTSDEVAERITALLAVAPSLSQRQVARIVGTSQSKVSRVTRA